jgi:hypothetical protein
VRGSGPVENFAAVQCFTILWQDNVQALQVQNAKGKWVDAVPIPGSVIIKYAHLLPYDADLTLNRPHDHSEQYWRSTGALDKSVVSLHTFRIVISRLITPFPPCIGPPVYPRHLRLAYDHVQTMYSNLLSIGL